MRENFTSGSVRGLIVTSEPLLQQEVGYELYSTGLYGLHAYALFPSMIADLHADGGRRHTR